MIGLMEEVEVLNLRGLKCPMPALLARRRLAVCGVTQIEILTDDPMAAVDIPHMCHQEGHVVVSTTHEGHLARFLLQAASVTE
nr:MAG: sulfurtransferase TusA family protein [Hyphomicrobiales bacterium]